MNIYDRLEKVIKKVPTHDKITIYVCGPTVYDHAHLGHGRSMIVFDVLHRLCKHYRSDTIFVQNITDIADQIVTKALRENISEEELSNIYIKSYEDTGLKLNILKPTFSPKVTDYLGEIIEYIDNLLKNSKATIKTDGIYMNLDENYGRFNSSCERTPFALWMFKDNYGFSSPWGNGRPGWHIECSAMSRALLGTKFTIHGGGSDLIFPHHENEIAQAIGRDNCIPAEIWMHNNMININGAKMSKSLGNFKYIKDFIKNSFEGDVLRLLILSYSYDSLIEFTEEIWEKNRVTLMNIRTRIFMNNYRDIGHSYEILDKLDNNLDTPGALQYIVKLLNNDLYDQAYSDLLFLGFKMEPMAKISPKEIQSLIEKRQEAKRQKNFKLADSIRDQLTKNWVNLVDNKQETHWHYL